MQLHTFTTDNNSSSSLLIQSIQFFTWSLERATACTLFKSITAKCWSSYHWSWDSEICSWSIIIKVKECTTAHIMNQKWHCSGRVCSTTLNYHCKLLSTNALALNTLQSKLGNVLSAAHTLSNTEMSGKCLLMNFRRYSPGSNKFIKQSFWSQPSSALTFPLSPTQQQTCFK